MLSVFPCSMRIRMSVVATKSTVQSSAAGSVTDSQPQLRPMESTTTSVLRPHFPEPGRLAAKHSRY